MATLNAQIFLNSFSDLNASNAPSMNNFRWSRNLAGVTIGNPVSMTMVVPAGQTVPIVANLTTPKRILYIESDQALKMVLNQSFVRIAPIVNGLNVSPAMFFSSTPTTDLSLSNDGSVDATVMLISAE